MGKTLGVSLPHYHLILNLYRQKQQKSIFNTSRQRVSNRLMKSTSSNYGLRVTARLRINYMTLLRNFI